MLKTFLKIFFILAIIFIANQVSAGWTVPKQNPPDCSDPAPDGSPQPGCNVPLNVSANGQTKLGALIAGGLRSLANLIVGDNINMGTPISGGLVNFYAGTNAGGNNKVLNLAYRNGTGGTPQPVGTPLSALNLWSAYSGNPFTNNAQIQAVSETAAWSPQAGLGFSTSNGSVVTERLRINGLGNVGIGTVYPAARLDVYGVLRVAKDGVAGGSPGANNGIFVYRPSNNSEIRTQSGTTNYADWGSGAFSHYFFGYGAVPFIIATNGTEKMRVDSGGNVGVGLTAPASKLDVNGDICWVPPGGSKRQCLGSGGGGGGTSYWATNMAGDIRNTNAGQVQVTGKIKVAGGNPGTNKLLVGEDDTGLARWRTLSQVMTDTGTGGDGIGKDVLNTTFGGCVPLLGCILPSGDPGPSQRVTIVADAGTVVMSCPAGYQVVSGGAECDNSSSAVFLAAVGFLTDSKPVNKTEWEVQCTRLMMTRLTSTVIKDASAIKRASITCAK